VAGDTVLWLISQEGVAGPGDAAGVRGVLYALGLADGIVRWQTPLGGFGAIGGAVVQDDTVFVSTPPSAYDLATGALRWRTEPANLGGLGLGGPSLDESGAILFVGAIDPRTDTGQVVALDAASGRPRWRGPLGTEAPRGTERLWLDGDTLIVPTLSGPVIGLDAGTGRERWRYRPTAPRLGSVTVADGRAWLVLENAHIVGLDTRTGQVVARFRDLNVSLNGQGINQRPALVDGRLVAAIGRMLLAFPLP
jgi:outer membrane protein assembly factor BamB